MPPEKDNKTEKRVRVTRVIVVEGDESWVDLTLRKSLVKYPGDTYPAAYGTIVCNDLDREEVE